MRLVRAVLVDRRAGVVEDLLLESLLKTSESLIIFRRRSGPIMQVAGAVDLLVYDAANPRSVMYQLDRLVHHLAELPKQSPAQRLGRRGAAGAGGDHHAAAHRCHTAWPPSTRGRAGGSELDGVLGRVDGLLVELLDSLRRTFFAHERLSVLAGLDAERPGSVA